MWNRILAPTAAAATAAAVVVLTLVQQGGTAQSAEIKVFSSAAPRGIFREIAPDFERTTGHSLVINYEFAADLKRRIEAPQARLVAQVDLGRTGMGVAVRGGAPKPFIGTVDAFRQPSAVPPISRHYHGASGSHVHGILARLGLAEVMKQRLRPYPSGGAVEAVARGEADLVVIGVSPILYKRREPAGWLPGIAEPAQFTGSTSHGRS